VVDVGERPDDPQFEAYHGRYAKRVFAFFRARGLCREDALDLSQDTWMQFRKGFGEYTKPEAVLFIIATQTFRRWVARERDRPDARRYPAGDDEIGNGLRSVAESAPGQGAVQRLDLMHALNGLPERQKTAVFLFYVADLKQSDVAEVMECSLANVKKLLAGALSALKASPLLAGYCHLRQQVSQPEISAEYDRRAGWSGGDA
jgi:RNA polymerase sigma factor (sigma-70 family)